MRTNTLIITLKAEEVSRLLTRPIKELKALGEAVAPLIEHVMVSTERPWWDLFGKMFSRKRDYTVMVAGVGTVEGLSTLIARLESMKSLCDNYGATEVQVSHEDMFHIRAAKHLVEKIGGTLEGMHDSD